MIVTGAGGQVGGLLAASAARSGYEVVALTRRDLDITDAAAVDRQITGAEVVINCAAFTDVDAAEADPDAAYAINSVGPGNLARACARSGARLVHISTDYVFDGSIAAGGRVAGYDIDDTVGPLGVYGSSKRDGELAVHAELPSANVVRTSWVFSGGGSGREFVAVMSRLAAAGGTVEVVADQIGSPTYAKDLVEALLEVARGDIAAPVLHAANAGTASRFEQARAVFAAVGADPQRVRPVDAAAFPRPARRPMFSPLSMDGSVRAGLSALRPWRAALIEALGHVGTAGPIPSSP